MKRLVSLRALFLLAVVLTMPALACGLIDRNSPAAPELPEDATENNGTGAEEAAPAPAEAPPFTAMEDMRTTLESFDSYRLEISLSFQGTAEEGARNGSMRIQTAQVSEPRASEVVVTMEGDLPAEMQGADTLTFTEIGNRAYTVFPGFGCISGTADELGGSTDEFSNVIETDDIVGDIDDADYVGEETIDGVATYHYRFDESHVEQEEGLDDMEGHLYIAQEGGYLVQMIVDGTGQVDLFDTGEMQDSAIHMVYRVSDVNVTIVIDPPAACANAGNDYPVMDGATELATMAGFASYKVDAPLADVVAFYDAEMPALGYTPADEQTIFEETAILTYSQEGQTVNVTVTEDNGTVSVLITGEDE